MIEPEKNMKCRGFVCPICHGEMRVIRVTKKAAAILRRRACVNADCQHRQTTREEVVTAIYSG